MRLRLAFLLVWSVALIGISGATEGAVISPRDLSPAQATILQQSEDRLLIYDRALQALDRMKEHHQISRQEFGYRNHDLISFISAEARFQNDLLTKNSGFAEDATDVVQNVARYSALGFEYLLAAVAKGLVVSSFSFTP